MQYCKEIISTCCFLLALQGTSARARDITVLSSQPVSIIMPLGVEQVIKSPGLIDSIHCLTRCLADTVRLSYAHDTMTVFAMKPLSNLLLGIMLEEGRTLQIRFHATSAQSNADPMILHWPRKHPRKRCRRILGVKLC